jgi:hemoglobin
MRRVYWCLPLLTACLLIGVTAAARAADEPKTPPPLERKALDEVARKTLFDVINQGADIYNVGNHEGCYRLYQGSLMTLTPLLDHRPELQKAIAAALADAQRTPAAADKAFVLRRALDRIRADLNPNKPAGKTLWDRLGGKDNVTKVVDDIVAAAAKDPKVDFDRGGKYKLTPEAVDKLKTLLVEFISENTGGPLKYSGRDMKEVHKSMGITNEQYDALGGIVVAALRKNGAAEDDVKAMVGFLESIRKDIVEGKKEEVGAPKTLWERLGGEANVAKVVDDFVNAAAKDPKVDFDRKGKFKLDAEGVARLKQLLIEQISSVSGGPLRYSGRDMKTVHKSMGITNEQFDALAGHLEAALKKNKAAPDDIKAVLAVVETTRKDIVEGKKEEVRNDGKKEQPSVTGKVTFDGKPLAAGTITFTSPTGASVSAPLQPDGTYAIAAKPGAYKVAISYKDNGKELLPAKYADVDKSSLTITVQPGPNNADFALMK